MSAERVEASKPDGFYELRRVIAANLRDNRRRRGWSLENVAGRLAPYLGRLATSTISAWESARNDGHAKAFTVEEIYAMCRVFDLNVAQLMAPPRVPDIEPITKIPGEEDPELVADVFGVDERNIWGTYAAYWLEQAHKQFEELQAQYPWLSDSDGTDMAGSS